MPVRTLKATLRRLARLTIWRYRPAVIGVTGSAGKTSTKLAIKAVLERDRRVRAAAGNLNSDIGLPLTILGDWSAADLALISRATPAGTKRLRKAGFWIKVIVLSLWRIIFASRADYPEILILEYGADRPGDIKRLLNIARPNISVITAIGDIPVHVEFYAGPEEVAREKGRLIEYLPSGGFAILNADDETVMNLQPRTRAHVMTFGFDKSAEVRISRFENKIKDGQPSGISFKLEHGSAVVPVRIDNVFGRAHAYAAGAAAAIGIAFGMNLVTISDALARYAPPESRMQLLPGVKYTNIIDDSYNASLIAMRSALETLRDLPAKRKVAVLGDMLEIGKYTPEAHEAVGRLAAKSADALFTVGPRAKFIAEAARGAGMKRTAIVSFDTADDARAPVKDFIRKGDLILVKGSHSMELNKVVKDIKDQTPVISPV
ncbi:MAG TPA: UDP-N-acetylmuramoyl-tripeptide--D-alanyl-D-alanine ligase [Candidatus Paceibacterota bacterium]|nr:UDP-N-acetylmuramoyl-tripeptide--D-alanyl-D-alanine ligase [Candidatus Paceibacterota bacterium]